MGAFRCVSNTKQQALCSLLLSPPRHALANPWTFCRKTQNQTTEPLFSSMFFFQAFLLFFIPIYLYFSPIQYFCSPFVLFFFQYSVFIHSKCVAILFPVQQISYLLLDNEWKTKPYAINCCKLPWIQIIIIKKPVRV